MPVVIKCPNPDCQRKIEVPRGESGKLACPHCQRIIKYKGVPDSGSSQAASQAEQAEYKAAARAAAAVRARAQSQPPPEPSRPLEPGEMWADRFLIRRRLGGGSFGTVYHAFDTVNRAEVALKIPGDHVTFHPGLIERFATEARSLATLRHPNIVAYYDSRLDAHPRFLAAEFVNGRDLESILAKARKLNKWMPPEEAVSVVVDLAGALHYAHSRGVVHRDLKPANVLALGDQVKLIDFGLARLGDPNTTQAGTLIGTPFYMSPEQVSGLPDQIGPHSDQYALGVLLFELLCKRTPFQGATADAVYGQILKRTTPTPRRYVPDLDARLAAICLKMLAKNPAARFKSCGELARELEPFRSPQRPRLWEPKQAEPALTGAGDSHDGPPPSNPELEPDFGTVFPSPPPAPIPSQSTVWDAISGLARSIKRVTLGLVNHGPERLTQLVGKLQSQVDILSTSLVGDESEIRVGPDGTTPLDRPDDEPPPKAESTAGAGERAESQLAAIAPRAKPRTPVPPVATDASRGAIPLDRSRALIESLGRPAARPSPLDDVALAVARWKEHARPEALAALDAVPREFRGWEWGYLRALCRTPRACYGPHEGEVAAVALDPAGTMAAAGETAGARIWNLTRGIKPARFGGHMKQVDALAFSPDGRRLAQAVGNSIRVNDVGTPDSPTRILAGHGAKVMALAFAADGVHLASASLDGSARIWDFETERERLALEGAVKGAQSLAARPGASSQLAVGAGDGAIVIWDWAEGRVVERISAGAPGSADHLAFHPSGRLLAAGGRQGVLMFSRLDHSPAAITTVAAHDGAISALAFHPSGRYLVSLGCGRERGPRVGAVDLDQDPAAWGRLVAHAPTGPDRPASFAFAAHDDRIMAFAGGGNRLTVWESAAFWRALEAGSALDLVHAVALHPDGRRLATARPGGSITVQGLGSQAGPIAVLPSREAEVVALAFQTGGPLLAAALADGTLVLWDHAAAAFVQEYPAKTTPASRPTLAWSSDGGKLVSTAGERSVRLFKFASGRLDLVRMFDSAEPATSAAFIFVKGRPTLAIAAGDHIQIHDLATDSFTSLRRDEPPDPIVALAPTEPRGMVSLSAAGTLVVWDPDSGRQIARWDGLDVLPSLDWNNGRGRLAAVAPDFSLILESID